MVSRFPSSNGLIEDPWAYEKQKAMINPWTSEEKDIFMEKFAAFGKDFRKIASFLDHKTTADCVEFYYRNHKSDCFEKIKADRKLGKSFLTNSDLVATGKKWNRDVNAGSLELLSAASAMAGHADSLNANKKMRPGSSLLGGYGSIKTSKGENGILGRSNSFDAVRDEREAVAADVLAGICGSLSSEAMSSCITSSVDPVDGNKDRKCLKVNPVRKPLLTVDVAQNVDDEMTCSDESCEETDPADWTDEEKSAFLQAVSLFGKDFAKISRCVGSRSQDQCKVFFSKARKCLGLDLMRPQSVNAGYPVNDDANGGGSDTDDACVVETGSAIGTDRSGTKTDEDQLMSVMNAYSDEVNPVEPRNLSADLNKSDNVRTESDNQDAEDVDNMVSDVCETKGKSKLDPGGVGGGDVLYSSDKSGSATTNMLASVEVGKDEANKSACAVTPTEPCQSNSAVEVKLVSEDCARGLGKELERGQKLSLPQCLDDRDNKHEAVANGGVELKSSVQDSSTVINASISSVGNSCTGLDLEAENRLQASAPSISALPMENSVSTGNSLQDTIAVQAEKIASQDQLPSTCDFQGRDMHFHNSTSNDGQESHIPRHLLDRVEATSILQGFPLPIKKEVNSDLSCSSSGTELPVLSQKTEQASDHYKTQSWHSLDSEVTSRNGDVKLFGKILTNSSSTQKSNQSSKGREENGANHSKLSSSNSPSLKFNGHQNPDNNSTMLKFGSSDYNLGLENVPIRSYGYWDGNKIQTGVSSIPDSTILLAKYPAAFTNYPTSSAKLEQQSLQVQAFSKSSEPHPHHLNGASPFASREITSGNGVIDYQMFRSREVPKVQPFMMDKHHHQDVVFSDVQRRNGFEAISNLQQQGRGMVGLNGVGRPGILVGGSHSGVSDFVAAIKMRYSNSEQYGGQNGTIMREDESWGGKKGDSSR